MKNLVQSSTSFADRASTAALAILGAIHITVLAVTLLLAMMMTGAKAQSAQSCGGENILDELADTDPAALQAIKDEAAKVVYGDTLLFKLEKGGVEPSYLFGTMHMTDKRVVTLTDAAQKAIDNADIVAIESTEVLDPAKAQVALFSKPELTMFTGDERLSDFLDEEGKEVLAKGLAERGMQLALIEKMKPWLLTGMLALPECEFARKQAGEPILDAALAQQAQAEGKELVGLETIIEQFNAISSLPIEFHVEGLVETLSMGDRIKDVTETMIQLYTEGQVGMVWPMLRYVSEKEGQGAEAAEESYADFEEALVTTRNRTMLERSLPLLEKGNAFIAVGALHLPGEKGLAQLYENAGYSVTPIR